ncbi:CU044_5270 family protein [Streptomyces albireticuli]|uniref:CU044_5270 family protein n=1 Tax=Streptomyces albireticuli TaxID=1940 RepID=A0A2A2DDI5_9ACTN|nr:CU044_5270 family protein [Streptomyces albireticuli]MCD9144971.1 CU044_5270 family protein [Streptomyces albireticuli]MCD9164397.1 CU044_5270 family protein [Streptomyces albireticuli]MCD9194108.1 CU044_5270 family protein [Streptomyces albireticuli]PAU49400.1 hypothetical protein CK936_08070 [Streptomyces albireticuli]
MKRMSRRTVEPLGHAEFDLLLPRPVDGLMPNARQEAIEDYLMDEITRTAPERPRVRRAAWVALPVAAAVIAGAVIAAPAEPERDSRAGAPEARERPGPGLTGLVDRISLAAARQPALEPRQDQYLYIESVTSGFTVDRSDGTERGVVTPPHKRQVWISPDGSKSFVLEPEHAFMDKRGEDLDTPTGDDRNSYNAVKKLPADPDALLERLYGGGKPGNLPDDWSAFAEVGRILDEQLTTPRTSAALYRAAARIPGVEVVEKATDARGRTGIALAFTALYDRQEWIFDKDSYAYLGRRSVLVKERWGLKPGTVHFQSAVVGRAVVDAKRQLPDGRML